MKDYLEMMKGPWWMGAMGIVLGLAIIITSFITGLRLTPQVPCYEYEDNNVDSSNDCGFSPRVGGIDTLITLSYIYGLPMFSLGILFSGYSYFCYRRGFMKNQGSFLNDDEFKSLWRIIRRWSISVIVSPLILLLLYYLAYQVKDSWYSLHELVGLFTWLILPILYSLAFYKIPLASYYIGIGEIPDKKGWIIGQYSALGVIILLLIYLLTFVFQL